MTVRGSYVFFVKVFTNYVNYGIILVLLFIEIIFIYCSKKGNYFERRTFMKHDNEMSMEEKYRSVFTVKWIIDQNQRMKFMGVAHEYANPEEVKVKINADWLRLNAKEDCYREKMVSFLPMLPLLEKTVPLDKADYILYAHSYARCEDVSEIVLKQLKWIDQYRKKSAEIIVVGKAANAEKLLNGSIRNITFWHSHYTEKLGEKFGFDIKDEYFVYDDCTYDYKYVKGKKGQLNIWPVNGCNRHCKFCRRSYMYIPFEYLPMEEIKEKLDWYKENHPEQMEFVSLRAENLTEYPWLVELIELLDSYSEIKHIEIPIGMAICGITKEILKAICRCDKIEEIGLNPEAGTDRMLQVIGKEHTRKWALYVFWQIRKAHPDIRIESTIMIGLPTETIKDIYQLADFLAKAKPNYIHCNYYTDNPGQPLSKLPQISESLREEHLKILQKQLEEKLSSECTMQCWQIVEKDTKKYIELQEENKYYDFPKHFAEYKIYSKK